MPRIYPVPDEGQALPRFGSDANSIRTFKVLLDNAQSGIKLPFGGSFLWAVDASSLSAKAEIAFKQDSTDFGVPFKQGTMVRGVKFAEVFVTNTAQAGEWILFMVVVEDFDNVQIQNPGSLFTGVTISKATTLGESADLSVVDAAAAVVAVAALSGRRTAIIGNKAASTGPVRVGVAPDDTHGIEVQPGMAVYLDVTADIKVFAPTGGGNQTITRNWIAD